MRRLAHVLSELNYVCMPQPRRSVRSELLRRSTFQAQFARNSSSIMIRIALFFFCLFSSSSSAIVGVHGTHDESQDERQLMGSSLTLGNKKVLMVRVSTTEGLEPGQSKAQLEEEFFRTRGSFVSPASQFKKCSYGKFTLSPFEGSINGHAVTGGVLEQTVDRQYDGDVASARAIASETTRTLVTRMGGESWRTDNDIDFVVYCMPVRLVSHAIFRISVAVMSENLCGSTYTLMHELGHVRIFTMLLSPLLDLTHIVAIVSCLVLDMPTTKLVSTATPQDIWDKRAGRDLPSRRLVM